MGGRVLLPRGGILGVVLPLPLRPYGVRHDQFAGVPAFLHERGALHPLPAAPGCHACSFPPAAATTLPGAALSQNLGHV